MYCVFLKIATTTQQQNIASVAYNPKFMTLRLDISRVTFNNFLGQQK